jgi:hypothetical protein
VRETASFQLHGEFVGDNLEFCGEALQRHLKIREVPLRACQVEAFLAGLVLLEMQDVAIVAKNEIGNRSIGPSDRGIAPVKSRFSSTVFPRSQNILAAFLIRTFVLPQPMCAIALDESEN